jgi:hypothetical protein
VKKAAAAAIGENGGMPAHQFINKAKMARRKWWRRGVTASKKIRKYRA